MFLAGLKEACCSATPLFHAVKVPPGPEDFMLCPHALGSYCKIELSSLYYARFSRLSFSYYDEEHIAKGIARLAAALRA